MIHTVKGFGIVNKAEVEDFLELSCFFDDTMDVGKQLIAISLQFLQFNELDKEYKVNKKKLKKHKEENTQ